MAIEFDGVDDYLGAIALIVSPPFSVSAWFYPNEEDAEPPNQRLFAIYGLGSSSHECRLDAGPAQTISAISSTISAATATTANGYVSNTWNHGLWTIDTALRTVALNGNTTASNSTSRAPTVTSTGIAGPTIRMWGRIAELAIWNVDLSLLSDYEAIKGSLSKGFSPYAVYPNNLTSWYRFVDGIVHNLMLRSFTLTANGAPFAAAHPRTWPPRHTGKKVVQGVNLYPGSTSVSAVVTTAAATQTRASGSLTGTAITAATTQTQASGSLIGTATTAATTQTGASASVDVVISIAGDESLVLVPLPRNVRAGVVYESNDLPDPRDVRAGIVYGLEGEELVGTLVLPDPADVRCGVEYGAPDE